MITKQPHNLTQAGSPSSLLVHDESSQMSLNPSYIQKSNPPDSIQHDQKQKKRLKFDNLFENEIQDATKQIQEGKSEEQIEIQIQCSNCLKKMSDFFKSQAFSYINIFLLILFLVNCTLQASQANDHVIQIAHKIDLGLQILFSATIMIKFTQYESQSIFWLTLDIITNIFGYLGYVLLNQPQTERYIQSVKVLRLLLFIKQSTFLQLPAYKLISSLSSVGKILFPAALFIYFYAVIGLYSFRDYEYSKCRDPANKLLTENWTVYEHQVFLCGQKQCPIVEGVQYQCLNPIDFGVEPNPKQVKNMIQGEGLMRYNNIFYSLFSTFKQTFITGSSRLMILGKQVTNYFYVLIYYLSFIYLLAYIYLNIFYGLMITNEEAHEQRRQSSFELKLNRKSSKRKPSKDIYQKDEDVEEKIRKHSPSSSGTSSPHNSISPSMSPKRKSSFGPAKQLANINQMASEQHSSQFQQVIDFHNNVENLIETNKKSGNLKFQTKFSKFAQSFSMSEGQQKQGVQQIQVTETQNLIKYGEILKVYYVVNHVIVILCSINILIDYEGQSNQVKLIVDCIDFAFFWVYFLEMIFRFVIHKRLVPNEPFDRTYKLDVVLFVLCTLGLIYEVSTAQNIQHFLLASDNISKLLRTLKYIRIFILISSTPFFSYARIIFNSTLEAVYSVRNLSLLWLLILVIFALTGYHLFQGKTKVDHEGHLDLQNGHPQHLGFEGILDSLIYTAFTFFNEEWDYMLFQQYVNQSVIMVIWQLVVLVIGLQILSKYFMALLMKQLGDKLNQQEQEAEQNQDEILQESSQIQKIKQAVSTKFNQVSPMEGPVQVIPKASFTLKLKQKQSLAAPQMVKKQSNNKRISVNNANGLLQMRCSILGTTETKRRRSRRESRKQTLMRDMILGNTGEDKKKENQIVNQAIRQCDAKDNLSYVSVESESCFNSLKMRLTTMLKSTFYKFIRVLFILVSIACTLGMHPHQNPQSYEIQVFQKIWYVTMVFFGFEIIFSVFALGLVHQKTGYLRNIMNWVYIIVFAIEILSIIPGLSQSAHLQALLSFRILRIFVFVELKYQADADMRLTIVAFWKLLPKMLNLLAITIIMYGFFAIILVKLYKDDYYYCDGYEEQASIVTSIDCMNWGGSWVQRKMNVSNIFSSLLYLFLVATTEGWSTQVIQSASLSGHGHQPEYGHSVWMEYFFSIFFFFGNLIMLNVFIGLSVYNFQKIKSQVTGLTRLSKDNKMWFSIKNVIHRLSPKMKDIPLQNSFSQYVHSFTNSYTYKIINVILFFLFMINMSLYTTNMNETKQKTLDIILNVFIGIFVLEYALGWLALGVRTIRHRKFIFETIGIVYFCVFFIVTYATHMEPKIHRMLYGIVICFLAIRYFTLLNEVEFVRKMINSLVSIFPQTSNIWLLIFVTLFTYAVIGIYFFGYLKIGPQLNEFDQNYTDLYRAIYALIKFSTLESPILQIVDATASQTPNSVCFDIYSYKDFEKYGRMGCGNPVAGYIFFLSFLLIYSLILLSTLLAVIVDAYSQVRREEQSMVNKFQLQEVQKQWENYDPQATGYIGYRDFWLFTAKLVKIYKVNKEQLLSHDTKQSFLKSLQIPIYEDQNGILSFQFHEVVEALTRIVVKQKMGPDWDTKEADKVFKNHHHDGSEGKKFKRSVYDSSHVLTLIIIKSGLKVWKRKANSAQTQKNLQNLLQVAKRQKQKAQIQNDLINKTNNNLCQPSNNSHPQLIENQEAIKPAKLVKPTSIQRQPQQVVNQVIQQDSNQNPKEELSKVKSPRAATNKNIKSERSKQHLVLSGKKEEFKQDDIDEI